MGSVGVAGHGYRRITLANKYEVLAGIVVVAHTHYGAAVGAVEVYAEVDGVFRLAFDAVYAVLACIAAATARRCACQGYRRSSGRYYLGAPLAFGFEWLEAIVAVFDYAGKLHVETLGAARFAPHAFGVDNAAYLDYVDAYRFKIRHDFARCVYHAQLYGGVARIGRVGVVAGEAGFGHKFLCTR